MAENAFGVQRLMVKRDGGDQVDQFADFGRLDLQLGVGFIEHAL